MNWLKKLFTQERVSDLELQSELKRLLLMEFLWLVMQRDMNIY